MNADIAIRNRQRSIRATRLVAEKQAVDELGDVHAAGYGNFLGMAGLHRFFHTPAADLRITSPEILEPVARAFADAVQKAVASRARVQIGDPAVRGPQLYWPVA